VKDPFFVDVEAAPAGLGTTALCFFSWVVRLDFLLRLGLAGGGLLWMGGEVLLNRRKLGVMLRVWLALVYFPPFIYNLTLLTIPQTR
jgi:hypothetical protein